MTEGHHFCVVVFELWFHPPAFVEESTAAFVFRWSTWSVDMKEDWTGASVAAEPHGTVQKPVGLLDVIILLKTLWAYK